MALVFFAGCAEKGPVQPEKPLARVFTQYLYPSDIADIIPEGAADSALIVDAYIQSWVRDKVMEKMAEQNVSADEEIERMVQDYKASLVLSKYEEALLQKNLDTTASETVLREFYERSKSQFPLATSAARCYYLKVPRSAPDVSDVRKWMKLEKDNDLNNLLHYAARHGIEFSFGNDWILVDELAAKLPESTLKERYLQASRFDFYASDEDYRYFVKVTGYVEKGSPSPYLMIKEDLGKLVLKKKKLETLKTISEQIFKNELSKNNVEVYSN